MRAAGAPVAASAPQAGADGVRRVDVCVYAFVRGGFHWRDQRERIPLFSTEGQAWASARVRGRIVFARGGLGALRGDEVEAIRVEEARPLVHVVVLRRRRRRRHLVCVRVRGRACAHACVRVRVSVCVSICP